MLFSASSLLQFEVSRGLGEVLLAPRGRVKERDVVSEFGPKPGPWCRDGETHRLTHTGGVAARLDAMLSDQAISRDQMTQRKKEIAKEREALRLREQAWRDEVLKMEARSRRPVV